MKRFLLIAIVLLIGVTTGVAQTKDEIKEIEKEYGMFTSHKKFFANKEWAMCKFSVVYKLTTSMTATASDNKKSVAAKIKSTSGAYAILNGITEADLQTITNKVAENFIKRMKDEAGVNVATWSSFKDSKNVDDLLKAAEDREILSKSQGLAYALSYDNTPHYNRMIVFIPGGKKLSKELNKNVMEMSLYIDFADVVATAQANITVGASKQVGNETWTAYSWSKSADQKLYPGVRLIRNLGSEALGEMISDMGSTNIKGHDGLGYMMSIGLGHDLVSSLPFVDNIQPSEGKIPEILSNRRNNKIESVTTYNLFTNPEKYGAAVLDVTNQYFDKFIAVYKYHSAD